MFGNAPCALLSPRKCTSKTRSAVKMVCSRRGICWRGVCRIPAIAVRSERTAGEIAFETFGRVMRMPLAGCTIRVRRRSLVLHSVSRRTRLMPKKFCWKCMNKCGGRPIRLTRRAEALEDGLCYSLGAEPWTGCGLFPGDVSMNIQRLPSRQSPAAPDLFRMRPAC